MNPWELIGIGLLILLLVLLTTRTQLSLALRLWRNKHLNFTWSRAWRTAGFHLLH